MKISVALCTYNGRENLVPQLLSLAWQKRLPDELIVCDDASTDDTVDKLHEFAKTAPFPIDIQVNPANLGSTKNFEQAITRCCGDVIALCDQDDAWKEQKLARIEASFLEDPRRALVISDADLLDETGQWMPRRLWQELPFFPAMQRQFNAGGGTDQMLRWNVVTGATAAFRADLRSIVLPIPDSWVHDGWIGFVAAAVAPAHAIAEPLVDYRQHEGQQIGIDPNTFYSHMQAARSRLTREYFERQTAEFEAMAERLEANAARLLDATLPIRVREKARLARTQARMREIGRFPRIGLAIRELAMGRYHQYARGLCSFGVDALFR